VSSGSEAGRYRQFWLEARAREEAMEIEIQLLRAALERIADPTELTGDGPLAPILANPHGTAERELKARMARAAEALEAVENT
jgi:hypothetical protein